jgi:hypothetical protein
VDGYGDSDALSKELLALIRCGRKRAGTSLMWLHEHEKEPLPDVGEIDKALHPIAVLPDDRPYVAAIRFSLNRGAITSCLTFQVNPMFMGCS